jgi:hypothetical protein
LTLFFATKHQSPFGWIEVESDDIPELLLKLRVIEGSGQMIFAMLGALTLACSLFAGYDMAIRRRLNVLYSIAFAVVLSVTAYVIIDLEYPRLGLMQVSDSDKVLVDLRGSMN